MTTPKKKKKERKAKDYDVLYWEFLKMLAHGNISITNISKKLIVSRDWLHDKARSENFERDLKAVRAGVQPLIDARIEIAEENRCLTGDTAAIKHYRQYRKGWSEKQAIEHSGGLKIVNVKAETCAAALETAMKELEEAKIAKEEGKNAGDIGSGNITGN